MRISFITQGSNTLHDTELDYIALSVPTPGSTIWFEDDGSCYIVEKAVYHYYKTNSDLHDMVLQEINIHIRKV